MTKLFTDCFDLELEELTRKILLKFVLAGNCLTKLFTELEICYLKNFEFVLAHFLTKDKVNFTTNIRLFLTNLVFNMTLKAKEKFANDNLFHNILSFCELYSFVEVLTNFPFTTSETMGDCYLYQWFSRVCRVCFSTFFRSKVNFTTNMTLFNKFSF